MTAAATNAAAAAAAAAAMGYLPGGASIPGVGDLTGWDPQLAKELEALLHDDPVVALPPELMWHPHSAPLPTLPSLVALGAGHSNPAAAAAVAAAAAAAVDAGHGLDQSASCPGDAMTAAAAAAVAAAAASAGQQQPEVNCDGEPMSPTLLR